MKYEVQLRDDNTWVTVHNGVYNNANLAAMRFTTAAEQYPKARFRIMTYPANSRRCRLASDGYTA